MEEKKLLSIKNYVLVFNLTLITVTASSTAVKQAYNKVLIIITGKFLQ